MPTKGKSRQRVVVNAKVDPDFAAALRSRAVKTHKNLSAYLRWYLEHNRKDILAPSGRQREE